jgi:hypothetical protein
MKTNRRFGPRDLRVRGTRTAFQAAAVLLALVAGASTGSAGVVLSGGGLQLVEEGGSFAPGNVAAASAGGVAIALDQLDFGVHFIPNVNNGTYGNSSSWIGGGATGTSGPFIGISLGAAPQTLSSIAFGRSNVTSGDPCGGGVCTDRWPGLYTLQYTTAANPNASTPDAAWITIGTLNYQSADPFGTLFSRPHLRHRYNFDAVSATGVRLIVPVTGLGGGTAIDEIELYASQIAVQPPLPGPPKIILTPQAGFSMSWNGNEGDHFSPAAVALAPDNLALASNGSVAFGSSEHPAAVHAIAHVNDGRYGNSNSWLSNLSGIQQYIGVRFPLNHPAGELVAIDSIAWSRDNGNNVADACGGQCADRSLGTYTIQFTQVENPGVATAVTGDATTGWQTLGTAQYVTGDPAFRPWLRHEFEVGQGGGSLMASGLRILISDPNLAIDELEVYGRVVPEPSTLALLLIGGCAAAAVVRRRIA